jgi:hypothetical protein
LPQIPGTESSRIEALARLFEDARLEDVAVRAIDVEVTYSSFDNYWQTFLDNPTPFSDYIKGLTKPDREMVQANVRSHIPIAADGTVTFAARANAVKGRVPG